MLRLLLAALPLRSWSDVCLNGQGGAAASEGGGNAAAPPARQSLAVRPPRSGEALADIVGLDAAKAVLREAVVLPAVAPEGAVGLFWRSDGLAAALLAGPTGLGKAMAAEAAAAAAGAHVLALQAPQALSGEFCMLAVSEAESLSRPIVVIIEALEAAPLASLAIRQCLREVGARAPVRVFLVATAGCDASWLDPASLAPFGHVARLGLPAGPERKQFLLRLLAEVSRFDPRWASALPEAAVDSLAGLTANYTFAELDLVVRRAFLLSGAGQEGVRDPVALHHFEKIIADMPPRELLPAAPKPEQEPDPEPSPAPPGKRKRGGADGAKKRKDGKDPMEAIFGWFNFWLPEALQLPPVVWAMTCFGILAHFMARTTYQPYSRKRRGGTSSSVGGRAGGGAGLWGDLGGTGHPYPPFGEGMGDWSHGAFAGFPQPPGGAAGLAGVGGAPGGDAGGAPGGPFADDAGGSCDQGGAAASGASGRGGRVRPRGSGALEGSPEGGAASSRGEPRPQGPKAPLGLGHALRSPPGRAD